jgi:hypothetical protein
MKYDLEKIKTVGDCYMCAGGLPFATNDHAFKMIQNHPICYRFKK